MSTVCKLLQYDNEINNSNHKHLVENELIDSNLLSNLIACLFENFPIDLVDGIILALNNKIEMETQLTKVVTLSKTYFLYKDFFSSIKNVLPFNDSINGKSKIHTTQLVDLFIKISSHIESIRTKLSNNAVLFQFVNFFVQIEINLIID